MKTLTKEQQLQINDFFMAYEKPVIKGNIHTAFSSYIVSEEFSKLDQDEKTSIVETFTSLNNLIDSLEPIAD